MAFYIVVHHPDDPDPTKWANEWDGGGLLRTITTPRSVANRCRLARDRRERIFVHRCAWGGINATIRRSVEVSDVNDIDRSTALVRFSDPKLLDAEPSVFPQQGQNSYDAAPPAGA